MAKREDNETILQEALTRIHGEVSYLQEERALCLQDRRFAFIAGAQWEESGWAQLSENMIRVEVNKTAIGLKRIQDDYRSNRVTVNFREVKNTAAGTADLLDGLFRADVYRCKGAQAFDNAFMEGTSGGMGAWLLANELEDEYDPDNEHQRIRFEAIVDADQRVFFDGNSKLYDKSDAQWAVVLFGHTPEAFKEDYPDAAYATWPEGLVKPHYDWYTPDRIVVAWYYRVEVVEDIRRSFHFVLTDETQGFWADELTDEGIDDMLAQGWVEQEPKKRKRKRVSKTVLSGAEVLKPKKWIAGCNIPVVPYFGQRVYIDNIERVQGHVRQAKDPQRIYNTAVSKLTETNAQSPIEKPIVTPDQIAGHEQHWAELTTNRYPYALLNPVVDENGNRIPAPPMAYIKPPELPPVTAALMQITASDIEQLTGSDDTASEVRSNVSAEAMDIAATRLDQRDGSYMDNFRQSMQRCGEIFLDMAKEVYFEEGREVETMDDDGQQSSAVLMEPYTDEVTGAFGTRNDLNKGNFLVIADVTEATATRRDKTVKACVNLADMAAKAGDTELVLACVGTAIENMDGEGIDGLKKWNRARMVAKGIVEPTKEEQAKLDQAQQQQQPDPTSIALLAQAKELEASAALKVSQAGKANADTKLSEAKVVETLASAAQKGADVGLRHEEMGLKKVQLGRDLAANDREAA